MYQPSHPHKHARRSTCDTSIGLTARKKGRGPEGDLTRCLAWTAELCWTETRAPRAFLSPFRRKSHHELQQRYSQGTTSSQHEPHAIYIQNEGQFDSKHMTIHAKAPGKDARHLRSHHIQRTATNASISSQSDRRKGNTAITRANRVSKVFTCEPRDIQKKKEEEEKKLSDAPKTKKNLVPLLAHTSSISHH